MEFGGAVQLRLGVFLILILHLARERRHRMHVSVSLLLAVLLYLQEIAQRMGAARCHHHRLGLPFHCVQRNLPELLHDDFRLLVDDVLVVVVEGFHGFRGGCLLVGRVLFNALLYLIGYAIRRILQQHVLDKAFLDGL